MGAGGAAGGGGNTGPDQGFFNTEAAKDKKANDDAAKRGNPDYQGELNSKSKNKGNKNNNNNNGGGGNDNNNTITQVTQTAPTEAEVSQATTTEADTEANRLLKIKKKGRSQSIISGSQGVTKMAADYSLGKKSLLGRV